MTNAREAAFLLLSKIERDKSYSNLVLGESDSLSGLSKQDTLLARRIVKTVLERKITIDYNLSVYLTQPLKKLKPHVLTALRTGACQLLFMDKIPAPAAINESVKLVKKHGSSFASGLVNAVLRKIAAEGLKLPEQDDYINYISVKYSFPHYICRELADYYGRESAEKIMASSLGEKNIYIRVNSLKNEKIISETEECPVTDSCLIWKEKDSIPENADFKKGLFHVQDLSSQLCCKVLAPEKGQTVIDVCAAPGGKSMTIAEIMENTGRVISCDIYDHKLKLIEDTAQRLGIDIIETRKRDGSDKNSPLPEADRILCDVPCSGFGVTGKKPEIKYKEADEIKDLPSLQLEILENSASYLKKGGRLVYSTCTLLPQENARVCRTFLERNKNFKAIHTDDSIQGFRDGEFLTVLPYVYGCDGFFIAAFERTV